MLHEECKSRINRTYKDVIIELLTGLYFLFRLVIEAFMDMVIRCYEAIQGNSRYVPKLYKSNTVLNFSAVTLAKMIKDRKLTSEELVSVCIHRIKMVNPVLNAVTDERFADALKEAQVIDDLIEDGLSEENAKKPFLGVPFTAKESHAVKGMLHTLGLVSRKKVRATEDAECVRLLREAGAIPIAVTNVPELNKWQETRNMVFGQTKNPYHFGRTTGGSSGGEAALCAAVCVPISLCSDIGGSTRMPAFYCGLFALNPTAGHTSMKGSALRSGTESTMASIGFVSRHCEDLIPLTKVVAGKNAALLNLDRPISVKDDIKFFYVKTVNDLRISPIRSDLKRIMQKSIEKLSTLVRDRSNVPLAYYHEGFNHCYQLWRHAMTKEADKFPRLLANNQGEVNGLQELAKKLVGRSDFTLAAILKLLDEQVLPPVPAAWAEDLTRRLSEDLIATLGSNGVLLFPSAPSSARHHYVPFLRPYNFALWAIFNALRFPAAQVPLGLDSERLPIGIQVVAAPGHDALCVAVADQLSKLFEGCKPPCY